MELEKILDPELINTYLLPWGIRIVSAPGQDSRLLDGTLRPAGEHQVVF